MHRYGTFLLSVLFGSVALSGSAEEAPSPWPSVEIGTRLRLSLTDRPGKPLTGEVLESSESSVLLKKDGELEPIRLDTRAIDRLEVSRGMRRQTVGGAACGAVAGGLISVIHVGLLGGVCIDGPCRRNGLEARTIATATLLATAVGAAIGWASREERWAESQRERTRIAFGVAPAHGALAAALTIRF